MSEEQHPTGIYATLKRAWHHLNDAINPQANKRRRIAANDNNIDPVGPPKSLRDIDDLLVTEILPFVGVGQFLLVAPTNKHLNNRYNKFLEMEDAEKVTFYNLAAACDSDKTTIIKLKAHLEKEQKVAARLRGDFETANQRVLSLSVDLENYNQQIRYWVREFRDAMQQEG